MSNTLTPEQEKFKAKREIALEKARARSKKNYDANAEKKRAYAQQRRDLNKTMLESIKVAQAINLNPQQGGDCDDMVEAECVSGKEQIETQEYTQAECIEFVNNDNTVTSNSKAAYRASIKRFFKLMTCKSLTECLKPSVFKQNLKKIEDSNYSISSIQATYQILVLLLDPKRYNAVPGFSKKHSEMLRAYVLSRFNVYKELVKNSQRGKNEMNVPTFASYLDKVLLKYGMDSKEYLISYLYSQITLRDDFKNLTLVRENNGNGNYMRLNKTSCILFLNDYKTINKYGTYKRSLNLKNPSEKKLFCLLSAYVAKNKIAYGNPIFGKTSLSSFVSKLHASIGYDYPKSGITLFRNMRVSDAVSNPATTTDDLEKLSQEMLHGLDTQRFYRRGGDNLAD